MSNLSNLAVNRTTIGVHSFALSGCAAPLVVGSLVRLEDLSEYLDDIGSLCREPDGKPTLGHC
ncbi:MAG: hypothetical protein ACOC7K_01600 [bacterium]